MSYKNQRTTLLHIADQVARTLGPNTTYDEAAAAMANALEDGKAFERSLEVQAMLVQQDPAVPKILERIGDLDQKTFKRILGAVNDYPWQHQEPYRTRLGRRHYVFSNRRAAAVFCYHRDVVLQWKGSPGAPKNVRVPSKDWAFKDDVENDRAYTVKTTTGETVYLFKEIPEGVLWGDLMMEEDEEV